MKTIFLLFVSSCLVLGSPRRPINTYDQRQDGSVNVHAKLDNFMFVFVPSSGIINDVAELVDPIVAAALNLKNVDSRNAGQSEIAEDHSSVPAEAAEVDSAITRINSVESSKKNIVDEESRVKIIAIVKEDTPEAVASQSSIASLQENKNKNKNKNVNVDLEKSETHSKKFTVVKEDTPEAMASQPSVAGLQEIKNKNKNVDVNVDLEKSEVHSKKARSLKNRSPGSPSVSKLPPKSSGSEPLENKVTGISSKDRGNDVGSAEREPQLLGGGIENCGPGRFRNRLGVCQFPVDA